MNILAGALGCVAGIIGLLPFMIVGTKIHKMFAKQGPKAFKYVLLLPLLSFILMVISMVIVGLLIPDQLILFGIACIATFLVGIFVFAIVQVRSVKNKKE